MFYNIFFQIESYDISSNLIYRRIDKISFLPLFIRLSNLKQRNFEILYRDLQIDFNSTSEYFRIGNGGRKKVTCERCSTCSQFPLAEVVRRTIAARMWSIVSSHRTTCMTHFRVHVYRLTWNIYSNRLTEHQPNPPFRQPFADLPPDRPRHPPVSSSPFPPIITLSLIIFNPFCNVQSLCNGLFKNFLALLDLPFDFSLSFPLSLSIKFLADRTIGFSW